MSIYAIGDIQGCFDELILLLDKINFDDKHDCLWFAGDLVNRGPQSLETIRFIKSLGNNVKTVLGNHDLHLLAVAHHVRKPHKGDTLDEIINADDADQLLRWLRQQPLLIHDADSNITMVHAGLSPQWSLQQTIELAEETEALFQSERFYDLLKLMYDDKPDIWSDSLTDDNRYRYIINCFTRMRYCDKDYRLNLKEKAAPGSQHKSLIPWYALAGRKTKYDEIIFGHWSTVNLGNENNFQQYNVYPLDSGCLWGGELTAIRFHDKKLFSVDSLQKKINAVR